MSDQLQVDLGTTLVGHQNAVESVVKESLGKLEGGFWIEEKLVFLLGAPEMHESRMPIKRLFCNFPIKKSHREEAIPKSHDPQQEYKKITFILMASYKGA